MCLGVRHARSALEMPDCPLCERFLLEEAPLLPGSLLKQSESGVCTSWFWSRVCWGNMVASIMGICFMHIFCSIEKNSWNLLDSFYWTYEPLHTSHMCLATSVFPFFVPTTTKYTNFVSIFTRITNWVGRGRTWDGCSPISCPLYRLWKWIMFAF